MINKKTKIIVFLLLFLLSVCFLFPILFVFISSFRTRMDVTLYPSQLLPNTFTLENYKQILFESSYAPVFRWLLNSTIVSFFHTLIVLVICSMAAYAFSRLEFKFKNTIFWILLSSMMIPSIVNFIPLYKLMVDINWVDTLKSLIFPGVENAFNIFLIRQFMVSIPKDLEESAFIDGANTWKIFTKIILPLSKPVLYVVGLFALRNNWNSLLWPMVAISTNEKRTITAGLSIAQGSFEHEFTLVNTVTVLSALPLLIVFIFVQKHFMAGLSASSGMKE